MTTWWPASLPQCMLRGLQRAPLPNTVSFGTEVGPGKVRRRSTARVKRIAGSVLLTREQVKIFEAFFENDLDDGALTFKMNDRTDGTTRTWRFEQPATYTLNEQNGGEYLLSMNLDRQP